MQKKIIQKIIYLFAILSFVVLWMVNNNSKILFTESSVGIKYWIIDLLILLPLLFQLIFNKKVGWYCILLLSVIHFIWTIVNIFKKSDDIFSVFIIIMIMYSIVFTIMYYLYPVNEVGVKKNNPG